jgi:predicted acyl esterase
MYDVEFRREISLLDIKWSGLFTPDTVASYAAFLREQFDRHRFAPGYRLRIDMSSSTVQTQNALRAFREHFANFPRASRIAIIAPSAITRLQVRHEMPQPYLGLFDTPEASLPWLGTYRLDL